MEAVFKQKLIDLIRQNECIYNPRNKDYKNKLHKLLLWEKIGTKLGIEGVKAKEMWRSLRDGYVRYKNRKDTSRKYSKYTWSSQLSFLEECIDSKTANIETASSATLQRAESPGTETDDSFQVYNHAKPRSSVPTSPPQSPSIEAIWTSTQFSDMNSSRLLSSEPIYAEIPLIQASSSAQINQPESMQSEKKEKPAEVKKLNSSSTGVDKVLDYLKTKNRNRREFDEVDHLFASYAKSFKKLTPRSQVKMKIHLAQLFAEAEIGEMGRKSRNYEESRSEKVYFSSSEESDVQEMTEMSTTELTSCENAADIQIKTESMQNEMSEMTENIQDGDDFENNGNIVKIEVEADYHQV